MKELVLYGIAGEDIKKGDMVAIGSNGTIVKIRTKVGVDIMPKSADVPNKDEGFSSDK